MVEWALLALAAAKTYHVGAADRRVVAMLISANFLGEMPVTQIIAQARAAGARVVPVVVRPVAWKGMVGDLAGLPKNERPITQWSDADAAWLEVTIGLKNILAAVSSSVR